MNYRTAFTILLATLAAVISAQDNLPIYFSTLAQPSPSFDYRPVRAAATPNNFLVLSDWLEDGQTDEYDTKVFQVDTMGNVTGEVIIPLSDDQSTRSIFHENGYTFIFGESENPGPENHRDIFGVILDTFLTVTSEAVYNSFDVDERIAAVAHSSNDLVILTRNGVTDLNTYRLQSVGLFNVTEAYDRVITQPDWAFLQLLVADSHGRILVISGTSERVVTCYDSQLTLLWSINLPNTGCGNASKEWIIQEATHFDELRDRFVLVNRCGNILEIDLDGVVTTFSFPVDSLGWSTLSASGIMERTGDELAVVSGNFINTYAVEATGYEFLEQRTFLDGVTGSRSITKELHGRYMAVWNITNGANNVQILDASTEILQGRPVPELEATVPLRRSVNYQSVNQLGERLVTSAIFSQTGQSNRYGLVFENDQGDFIDTLFFDNRLGPIATSGGIVGSIVELRDFAFGLEELYLVQFNQEGDLISESPLISDIVLSNRELDLEVLPNGDHIIYYIDYNDDLLQREPHLKRLREDWSEVYDVALPEEEGSVSYGRLLSDEQGNAYLITQGLFDNTIRVSSFDEEGNLRYLTSYDENIDFYFEVNSVAINHDGTRLVIGGNTRFLDGDYRSAILEVDPASGGILRQFVPVEALTRRSATTVNYVPGNDNLQMVSREFYPNGLPADRVNRLIYRLIAPSDTILREEVLDERLYSINSFNDQYLSQDGRWYLAGSAYNDPENRGEGLLLAIDGRSLVNAGNLRPPASTASLFAYPNPTAAGAKISWESSVAAFYELEVINPLGQIFYSWRGSLSAGSSEVILADTQLPTGNSFIRIRTAGEVQLIPITKY